MLFSMPTEKNMVAAKYVLSENCPPVSNPGQINGLMGMDPTRMKAATDHALQSI